MSLPILESGARALGLELNARQVEQFERYMALLLEWNSRFNLTRITSPEEVETKHFLDSLTAVLALRPEPGFPNGFSILDVGSGAGFPGIPFRIAFPTLAVTLLEATGKKVSFLGHTVDALELTGTVIVHGRAEERAREIELRESFQAVAARAVAPLSTLCEIGLPFVEVGGLFVALKKGDTSGETAKASSAIARLGGTLASSIPVEVEGLSPDRHLICIRKVSNTPREFPRRPGVPAQRPL